MTADRDNPPAFPLLDVHAGQHKTGMSLRDWFAGQALAGMLANGRGPNTHWLNGPSSDVASHAYDIADAMMRQRQEKPDGK